MTVVDPFAFATEQVFDLEAYHRFYSLPPERTNSEIVFLVERLGLAQPCRILDLACGHGRHANRLAELGHRVTGMDISSGFLDQARSEAKKMGVSVDYRKLDMRNLDEVGAYDLVTCLFTAFGYFRDEENTAVIHAVARALAPGGRFFLDILNRDGRMRKFQDRSVVECEQDLMIDRNSFDAATGRFINQRTYIIAGRRTEAPFSVRLYHLQELTALFAQAGLRVENAWGDWKGNPVTWDSHRLMVVGRKGATP